MRKIIKILKKILVSQCLKITEKVSFNKSEASYVHILSGQKFIKNWSILASFWTPEACGQTVLPDRSLQIGQKLIENDKIVKLKWDIFSKFFLLEIFLKFQTFFGLD